MAAGDPREYDGDRHLFPADVLTFIEPTRAKKLAAVRRLHQDRWGEALLGELVRELDLKGSLHLLRHGFKAMGRTFASLSSSPTRR